MCPVCMNPIKLVTGNSPEVFAAPFDVQIATSKSEIASSSCTHRRLAKSSFVVRPTHGMLLTFRP